MTAGHAAWLLGATAVGALLLFLALPDDRRTDDPERIEEGRTLYVENCASCHGKELEGQPEWKRPLPSGRLPAPPHDATGHTWHHPDGMLLKITRSGPAAVVGDGYQSDMPGFEDVLTDEQIRSVFDYIKSTWSERERQYQAERSEAEQER